jgi:hypothetical protein
MSNYHFGVGGEGVFRNGIGIGGEVGYLTTRHNFDGGFGLASINGSYHFNQRARLVPFVTGGYSLDLPQRDRKPRQFRGRRELVGPSPYGSEGRVPRPRSSRHLHLWGFRFGVTFR